MKLRENILFLILKKEYFNEIESGKKKYEYRNITPYWQQRLAKHYDYILFQCGYSSDRRMLVEFKKLEIHRLNDMDSLYPNEEEFYAIRLGAKHRITKSVLYEKQK